MSTVIAGNIGLWVHVTDAVEGRLHDIKNAGFDYLLLKVADGHNAYHAPALAQVMKDAAAINLPVVAWAYVYPNEAAAQAQAIAAAMPSGVSGLVLDAESEFEGLGDLEAENLAHAVAEAIKHRTLLYLSSFWSPMLHPEFPFAAFMRHCDGFMPQCYLEPQSTRKPSDILTASLIQSRGIKAATQMVVPTINNPVFVPLLKAKGVRSFNVYCFDGPGDAQVINNLAAWQAAITDYRTVKVAETTGNALRIDSEGVSSVLD